MEKTPVDLTPAQKGLREALARETGKAIPALGEVTRQRAAAKTRELLQDPHIQALLPSQALFLDGLARETWPRHPLHQCGNNRILPYGVAPRPCWLKAV